MRVYELARQLNMTNKVLLERLKELNISVKSHMSVVDEEKVTQIKGLIFGTKSEVVVEERVKETLIRRRRKIVKKPPEEQEVALPAKTEGDVVSEAEQQEAAVEVSVEVETAQVSPVAPEKVSEEEESDRLVEAKDTEAKPEEAEPAKKVKPKKKPRAKKEKPAKIIKLPEIKTAAPDLAEATPEKGSAPPVKAEPEPPSHIAQEQEKPRRVSKGKPKKTDQLPPEASEKDKRFLKKKISFRKKEVLDKSDLYDKGGFRGRKGRKPRKGRAVITDGETTLITTPKAIKRRIKIDEAIVVSDLARRIGIKASEVIKGLMAQGVIATINQAIDFDTASVVASEFGYEVETVAFEEENIVRMEKDDPAKLKPRPPVVTIMGHVDHGKTSLLDAIRETNVIDGEAGGITQHIGAYSVNVGERPVVFLDTPGHEAFTAMRARGAEITDMVVLVVAADDGVMPQTIEAINHAKAANVPILVAINKIDKPDALPDRVKRELAEQGLTPEEWSGETIVVNISAKQRIGLRDLLEMILLQADVQELKANPDKLSRGTVIEAKLDPGKGSVATVLVQDGTLRPGDPMVCGTHYGRIRAMIDDRGNRLDKAGPSIPVEIQGLSGVPMAGDEFVAMSDEKAAKQVAFHRAQKQRTRELVKSSKLSLEMYYEQMQDGIVKELNLIIRADVQGSIEALSDAVHKIESKDVKVNIVHSATGAIAESDIMLAKVSDAIVLGFNVRPGLKVRQLAIEQNIDIRFYDVIYNVINDMKGAIAGLMESTFEEHLVGRAEVRDTFSVSKVGMIAGCYVTEGKIERGQPVRLLRDSVVIYKGKIRSLRRFKDDVKEVQSAYECGIGIENYNDVKVGDVIECYEVEEIKPVVE
ncbi:MAG: translation initiation factor IF-2 [Desulfobacterales bacterium S5133MH4]|nr:MAG: translation initiation factor IF-2 [Desulfobacterales bacterium S5133MH4]